MGIMECSRKSKMTIDSHFNYCTLHEFGKTSEGNSFHFKAVRLKSLIYRLHKIYELRNFGLLSSYTVLKMADSHIFLTKSMEVLIKNCKIRDVKRR
jgi:hypothetical protein